LNKVESLGKIFNFNALLCGLGNVNFDANFVLPSDCEHSLFLRLGYIPLHNQLTLDYIKAPAACDYKEFALCGDVWLLDDAYGEKIFSYF